VPVGVHPRQGFPLATLRAVTCAKKLLGRGGMVDGYSLMKRSWIGRGHKIPRFGESTAGGEERFLREERAAAMLSHPNLANTYGTPAKNRRRPLPRQDYVRAKHLSDLLRDDPSDAGLGRGSVGLALRWRPTGGASSTRPQGAANVMIDQRGQAGDLDSALPAWPETG